MNTQFDVDTALALFAEGYNCAQAVFAACGPQLGLDRDTCLRIASGFGGGMGRTASTCGAVTGAFMTLGLAEGSAEVDPEAKRRCYAQIREFAQRFTACHTSIVCKELLGVDISTEEGFERAQEMRFHTEICPRFVQTAVEILNDMGVGAER